MADGPAARGTTGRSTASPVPAGVPDHLLGVRGVGVATAVALLGALAVALAPLAGVARAADGSEAGPQPVVTLLTAVLVLLLPALALVLLREGRVAGAAGVLLGAGAVAVGAAVADGQLLRRAIDANRLELVRPTTAAPLAAGAGTWLVLGGHLALLVAGVLAGRALRRSGILDDPDAAVPGGDGRSAGAGTLAARVGAGVLSAAVVAAVLLAAAQLAPPLRSADPVVLVPAVVEGPVLLVAGAVLVALAVLVVAALASVSASLATAAGALAGAALGGLALAAPRLLAGLLGADVGVGWGSVLATVAALALLGVAGWVPVAARRRLAREAPADRRGAAGPELPSARRLTRATGLLALLAGVLAVAGALLPAFTVPAGVAAPDVPAARVLLVAGVLLAAAGAGVLVGGAELAGGLRPVPGVAWAGVVLAAGGLLQAVVVGLAAPGVGAGAGAWLVVAAVLLALGAGAAAGLAGGLERDEVDTSHDVDPGRAGRLLVALVALGALLLVVLPAWRAPAARAPALLGGSRGLDLWALVVAAGALVVVAAVALRARRSRGRAALLGALLVALVVLAGWPLGSGAVGSAGPGPGLVGLAAVLVGLVGLALRPGAPAPPAPVRRAPARRPAGPAPRAGRSAARARR